MQSYHDSIICSRYWNRTLTGIMNACRDAFKALMFSELDFERPPWDIISADGRDLVSSLLQKDPAKRITAKAALKHRSAGDANSQSHTLAISSCMQRIIQFEYARCNEIQDCYAMASVGAWVANPKHFWRCCMVSNLLAFPLRPRYLP